MGKEEFGEESQYSILFGHTHFNGGGGHLSGFRGIGRPGIDFSLLLWRGPRGPGWTFTQGPLSRWSLFRKLGGSLAVVGSSLGKCGLIPRVRATELSWAG